MARLRVVPVLFVLVFALGAAALRLVWIQGVQADELSRNAARQRIVRLTIPAVRGELLDRNGFKLAFSVETRALAWSPKAVRARYAKSGVDFDKRTAEIAAHLKTVLREQVDERELLVKLRGNDFSYLAVDVEPAQERLITEKYRAEIEVQSRLRREYPGGAPAANVIGSAIWHDDAMHGRSGLEASLDRQLAGEAGSVTVDTAEGKDGIVIPGSERDRQPARDGADVHLTIDADLQYFVRQRLSGYAKGASVVVQEVRTGEVYALVADEDKPFEPGPAIAVVETAAEAEDAGEPGPDRYAELLRSFGLGERTGIGLPGEHAGTVPDRKSLSRPAFTELRQGKGLTVTALQLTGMYQAAANGGYRVPPRIVKDMPGAPSVRVVSERAADAVLGGLAKAPQSLPGYRVAGTAGGNSFTGILPAADPRFVIGIVLNPGEDPQPLFHDIASYVAQRFRIPAAVQPG